jgi:multidrug efflux pump subunit AcrB
MLLMTILYVLHHLWLKQVIYNFQTKHWPKIQDKYKNLIIWSLKGKHSIMILGGTVLLLVLSFVITAIRKPGVVFFPQADPNFTYVYLTLPTGTSAKHTDSIVKIAESITVKGVIIRYHISKVDTRCFGRQ